MGKLRLTPATAISLVALFVAVGGTGYAASQIETKDIAAKAVTGSKIAPATIKGSKLRDDTITGKKVNESTLGEVPSAAQATNANTAGSVSYTRPFFVELRNIGDTAQIASHGQVSLHASCAEVPAAGDTQIRIVAQTTNNRTVMIAGSGGNSYDGSSSGSGFLTPDRPEDQRVLMAQTSSGEPTQTDVDAVIDGGSVMGEDGRGLSIDAETTILGANYLGSRCVLAGMVSSIGAG